MNINKKVSIIVPCYNTEKYVNRCIDSIINQTYKNLEIIVVNDCSPGKMKDILEKYKRKDKRIKVINHPNNKGLFQARLSGAKIATGDYIAFLDSDDYVDFDFYRELVFSAEVEKSDMVVCNTVLENKDNKYIYNLFTTGMVKLENNEILNEYFNQKGYNYRWHTVWNKLYKMDLWKKAEKHYSMIKEHLIMTEDFAFSTVLFYYAKKMIYNDRANYFYCENDDASTSLNLLTEKKCKKNITDIKKSFLFVQHFLEEKNVYKKYQKQFVFWKSLYLKIWWNNVKNASFKKETEEELLNLILEIDGNFQEYDFTDMDNFYSVTSLFNDNLLKLKKEIISHDVISFDIFDTLILRPFYEPKDMFVLLNEYFNKLFESNGIFEFSEARVYSEMSIRNELYVKKSYEDITLNDIYDTISKQYKLPVDKLKNIKIRETELEINFCTKRETMYSIYCMCKYLNKRVVATTDMYLPRNTIERILQLNGYQNFDRIYISGEEKISKNTGNLFKHLVVEQKVSPERILHIGDNIKSDVEIPRSLKIDAFFFPKTIDLFNNYCYKENNVNFCGRLFQNFQLLNIDHTNTTDYLGNRISQALVANKFFDNPFVSFNEQSDFNCNPYLIGYYILGMHILSLSNWIINNAKEKKYDSICFQARDGYLPYLAVQKLKDAYKMKDVKINYVYCSRNSLLPLILNERKNYYKIKDYINLDKISISDFLDSLSYILKLDSDYEEILNENGLYLSDMLSDNDKFYKLIDIIYDNFYDEKKYEKYYTAAKKYFSECFVGKTATFDIGYSAKPELIISNILKKGIDTYFVHCCNDTGFKNSVYGKFKLYTFYDFKPTFTGTLREYIISSDQPSCKGYKLKNNNISIDFSDREDYTYFNKKMLEELHNGCLDFIQTYIDLFKDYNSLIELNKYYMSLPLEYYLHFSKKIDRNIFLKLKFENSLLQKIDMCDFWNDRINEYANWNLKCSSNQFNLNGEKEYTYNKFLDERVKCRNKFTKFFFYLFFDRIALRHKLKLKLNNDGRLYKFLKKIYDKFKRR